METNSILTANILDIVFEGRNKEYGAYDLRKTYKKRILSSLMVTATIIVILAIALSWKKPSATNSGLLIITDPTLLTPPPEQKIIIPPKPVTIPPVRTITYTPPLIVMDNLVTEPPVENDKLDNARIDTKTNNNGVDETVISPPAETKVTNAIEAPVKKETHEDEVLIDVQIPATFKGDWSAYVKKEIERHMDELTEAGESGTCLVKFIVSKDGSISNVEAVTMKGSKLAEVAVNAIRKGPKWKPAENNGIVVNAYREQPITFKITD